MKTIFITFFLLATINLSKVTHYHYHFGKKTNNNSHSFRKCDSQSDCYSGQYCYYDRNQYVKYCRNRRR